MPSTPSLRSGAPGPAPRSPARSNSSAGRSTLSLAEKIVDGLEALEGSAVSPSKKDETRGLVTHHAKYFRKLAKAAAQQLVGPAFRAPPAWSTERIQQRQEAIVQASRQALLAFADEAAGGLAAMLAASRANMTARPATEEATPEREVLTQPPLPLSARVTAWLDTLPAQPSTQEADDVPERPSKRPKLDP